MKSTVKIDSAECLTENYKNFIRLSLKKPKNWNWSLTTSVSSPEVEVPDIQLVDHKGNLLVDTRLQKADRYIYRKYGKAASFSAGHLRREESVNVRTGRSKTPSARSVNKIVVEDCDHPIMGKGHWSRFDHKPEHVLGECIENRNFNVKSTNRSFNKRGEDNWTRRKSSSSSMINKPLATKAPVEFAKHVILSRDITGKHVVSPTPKLETKPAIGKSASFLDSRSFRSSKHVSFSFSEKTHDGRRLNKSNSNIERYNDHANNRTYYNNDILGPPTPKNICTNNRSVKRCNQNVTLNGNTTFENRIHFGEYNAKKNIHNLNVDEGSSCEDANAPNVNNNNYKHMKSHSCSEFTRCIPRCTFLKRNKSCRNPKTSKYLDDTQNVYNIYHNYYEDKSPSTSGFVDHGNGNNTAEEPVVSRRRRSKDGHRRRMRSKQREESLGSSSSSEEYSTRPSRTRRRRIKKQQGDRLVAVDGQSVTSGDGARELLLASGEEVRLQLLRHGLRHKSLPGHRLDERGSERGAGEREEEEAKEEEEMGSNLSRHSGKGLTGRRSQSSGNLCNGKALAPSAVGRFFSPCGRGAHVNESVGPRDRYKFCGSLPNHLDAKDPPAVVAAPAHDPYSCRSSNNNNEPLLKSTRNDLELRLHPLARADQDQGYGSERSPEDPPPPGACHLLSLENTFTVSLVKGSQGLGLSLAGGTDQDGGGQWPPGLVRIKRLFPHQPAWECGQLRQGDILLTANSMPLTGLTNYEALEILRTTPSDVVLTVCRPPGGALQKLDNTPATPAPPPPRRDPLSTSHLTLPLKSSSEDSFGEFDVVMTKVNGSLGFTLRKEDESVLGHYVRALVREPALSDGRVKPGDKIVAVNDVDMSQKTHEEAVLFLRQCGQEVRLRLYRDRAQTPVSALSPVQSCNSLHRSHKPILRKEAQDMLSDLAVKKSQSQSPGDSTASSHCRLGRSASPRKRRGIKTSSPDSSIPNGPIKEDNSLLIEERLQRPDSLDLSGTTKLRFQLSKNGANDGDSSLLDTCDMVTAEPLSMPPLSEPVSMPPLLTSESANPGGFSYRNPAYRSANPTAPKTKSLLSSEELPNSRYSDQDLLGGKAQESKNVEGTKGLLKWKGVVFSPEEGANNTSPDDSISQITESDTAGNQVLIVELNRGWNSRLGFSLQSVGHSTVISAIYPDSVASRDGRLRPGDQLIMVNDESVEGMGTNEVIDLLRKIRGSICITVWRKPSSVVSSTQTNADQDVTE